MHHMRTACLLSLLAGTAIVCCTELSSAQSLTPRQQFARDIYQELVEINTVTHTGDTLRAAEAMAARLRAAGFDPADVQVLSPVARKGNLVARLRRTGARKPILLLAHIDVVEARREDWSVDPFGTTDLTALSLTRLSANPVYNAQLRTTCVATLLEGGHAINALPQLARAGVNCRITPGEPIEEVQATLVRVLADDQIKVTQTSTAVVSAPSALHEEIMGAIETVSAEFWPAVPIIPTMSAGATDGSFLRNAGIPTYGHSGLASEIGDNRIHGRDERVLVKSFWHGQEYLYRLIKMLVGGK